MWMKNSVDLISCPLLKNLEKANIVLIRSDMVKTFQGADLLNTGPPSAVGNVSGYRCMSDCRSRGHEFDPGPVPYFRGD